MSDVKRYSDERSRRDPAFAEEFESGYETFKAEVMTARSLEVRVERDEEGRYVASVPALHGCHTQARSLDVLKERLQEAIELCLEAEGETPETYHVKVDWIGRDSS